MKKILQIQFSESSIFEKKTFHLFNEDFELEIISANSDLKILEKIILQYDEEVDVIAISGLPNAIILGKKRFVHPAIQKIFYLPQHAKITDGQQLRDLFFPWTIRKILKNNPDYFKGKKIGFFFGFIQTNHLEAFTGAGAKLYFADLFFLMKIPLLIEGAKNFEKWLKRLLPFSSHLKINHLQKKRFLEKELIKIPMLKNFLKCDFYVANGSQLNYIETDLLKNKILLTESLSPLKKSKYLNLGVKEIIDFCPKTNLSIENNEETTYLGSTIIEACMLSLKDDRAPISFKEMNHYIDSQELHSDLTVSKNHLNEKKHFGFLIHPLSSEDFFRVALVKKLKKIPHLSKILEKVLPQIPIFEHARVYNIKSDFDNSEVEGIIYVTLETPKTLLKVDSEKFYRKVLYAIEDAKTKGAKIFGLGAYTKIVGDSGVTLSKRSPLPITTGNSLSAASTLWAAHYGIKKMGFVKIEQGICRGKAMIVGATGSIGKVTAKLLAEQWEEIILVAPRMFKLMEIKEQIEQMFPNTKVQCTTDPHDYLSECDLLITSTSNQEGKLMDIEKVKPGAVICDVSRPFDFTLEDMVKRPDILIISCGEIELPGTNVKVTKDIGLQGQVVYACLAETALLAMEGMLESFSLSRDISFEKIKIIDKLARKHGLKLAAIRSINAEITPEELETCRKHALSRRKKMTITSNVAAKKVQTPAPRSRIKVSKN